MADKDSIDKALPNVDPEVVLPEEEIVVTEEQTGTIRSQILMMLKLLWMRKAERKLISIQCPNNK